MCWKSVEGGVGGEDTKGRRGGGGVERRFGCPSRQISPPSRAEQTPPAEICGMPSPRVHVHHRPRNWGMVASLPLWDGCEGLYTCFPKDRHITPPRCPTA